MEIKPLILFQIEIEVNNIIKDPQKHKHKFEPMDKVGRSIM